MLVTEKGMGIGIPLVSIMISPHLGRQLLSQFSIQLIISNYLKNYTRVPRPISEKGFQVRESGYSFPSLHSSTAVGLSLVANDFFQSSTSRRHQTVVMASMLVGMARTYLGVHTWSDVTAGWTLGYMGYRAERSLQVQSYWRPIWLVFLMSLVVYTNPQKDTSAHLVNSFREALIGLGTYVGTQTSKNGWLLAISKVFLVISILRTCKVDMEGPHADSYRTILKYFLSSDGLFRILEQL
jgi:hypothetical protein